MKKILILLTMAIVGVSCISESDINNAELNLDNLSPFIEKTAPVREGFTTVIKVDTTIICQTNTELNYFIPKDAKETITYVPSKKDVIYGGWSTYQFTACFEDTRSGDNDYNDFVCFITIDQNFWETNSTSRLVFYVQPIAYGAGENIQFGITLPNGEDTLITDNVRRDLFPNTTGFVNTVNPEGTVYQTGDINHIRKYQFSFNGNSNGKVFRVHPFIINEKGEKLYVALNGSSIPARYTSIVSTAGYPLGIATSGAFAYPKEKENIKDCYTNFNNWILGNSSYLGGYSWDKQSDVFYKIDWGIGSGGIIYFNPQNLF